MAIKYLRGIYGIGQARTTRPVGFDFPIGLKVTSPTIPSANSANSATGATFDTLIIAGGGNSPSSSSGAGGSGAGGMRIFSANSFSVIPNFQNPSNIVGTTNFIPITVGGAAGDSCIGDFVATCRGGNGGESFGGTGQPGGAGGGGGGGSPARAGGTGILGQGCDGGTSSRPSPEETAPANGGSVCANASTSGITSSITGTAVRYGDGGAGRSVPAAGTANRGNGASAGQGPNAPQNGGSGLVAIRYRNPAAPTTPVMTGGNTVCCTGGCIIHVFTSSGFLNVNTSFSIN